MDNPELFECTFNWMGPSGRLNTYSMSFDTFLNALMSLYGFLSSAIEAEAFGAVPAPLHMSLSIHQNIMPTDPTEDAGDSEIPDSSA